MARAAAAQREWAKVDFDERRAVLHDLLDMVIVNRRHLAHATWLDTGKSRAPPLPLPLLLQFLLSFRFRCTELRFCVT